MDAYDKGEIEIDLIFQAVNSSPFHVPASNPSSVRLFFSFYRHLEPFAWGKHESVSSSP